MTSFLLIFFLLLRFVAEFFFVPRFQAGKEVFLKYCLKDEPYFYARSQIFYFQRHFQQLKIILPADNSNNLLTIGDCLDLSGKISLCDSFGRKSLCLLNPKVNLKRKSLNQIFLNFRSRLVSFYLSNLPYPQADLLAGIALGAKQNLDKDFYSQLVKVGVLHIVVASGFNLSLIGVRPVDWLAYFFGRKLALIFGFIFIWGYAGLVGFSPPVVRAAIILSSLFLAQFLGKMFNQWRSFFLTVWLMLMVQPDLIASVSFQLSVAATFGILIGSQKFKKIAEIPFVGSDLASTLAAQAAVFPLVAWHFGKNSLVAPLANLLILPLVPWITGLGIFFLPGTLFPAFGRLFLWLLYPMLYWATKVVEVLSHFKFAELSLKLNWWQTALIYLGLFILIFHKELTGQRTKDWQK